MQKIEIMKQRSATLAGLRHSILQHEKQSKVLEQVGDDRRIRFGIAPIDATLGGGLEMAGLHEIRCSNSRDIGCAFGLFFGLLAGVETARSVIWISDPSARMDAGTLFPDGLLSFGFAPSRLLHIRPMRLTDVLWAAGEASRTGGSAITVMHVMGNPGAFDLSASRKLLLRAQKSGSPFFVLRQSGAEEASSAVTRWHVEPKASLPDENFSKGMGNMRLALTLEKNRNGQLGQWSVAWNPAKRSFINAAIG